MTDQPEPNFDAYCCLKQQLEPQFSVVAEPQAGYYAQWQFCYRVFDGDKLLAELQGDFRDLPDGWLMTEARRIVETHGRDVEPHSRAAIVDSPLPIASRLPPRRDTRTWFSSGRAAYSWLLRDVVKPRRVFLPTYVCWSLVDVMLQRFPDVQLQFYAVDKHLDCDYPSDTAANDAVVDIHYFGRQSSLRHDALAATVLEDCSHCLLGEFAAARPSGRTYRFGSLRKAYRVADGGFVDGQFCPVYEADAHTDAWLRLHASDWRDLREAENMVDREFRISDISSQSVAVILTAPAEAARSRRQANNTFLNQNFPCGRPLVDFADREVPLLHNRCFDSQEERDSLRSFLLQRQVFTSVHWPVHDHLLQQVDSVDIADAVWLQDQSFAIPVAEDFGERQMNIICDAATQWQQAGGSRFSHRAAG